MHPTELAPSADPQAEQGSSGYSTAPESAGSSTSVGSARASTRRPDHAARIRVVLQARLMALLLRSSVRGVFRAWRRLVPSWPKDAQHRSDDELSVASASSVRGRHRREHRRKRGQRQARRPPDRHSSGSDASNEGRKGALGFNKDFPYINAKAACIKCGEGWMPGYWHRRARVHVRGYPTPFDPLADKIMCDGCRNKYPLGPYYFKEYTPYVTKAEVERVRAESSADYVNPAEDAAACFEKYRAEKFNTGAAEHDNREGAADDDWLPDDASAQDILSSVPVYDARAAVRSALAMWVGVVREHTTAAYNYNVQHAQACAEVLPILDQIVRDADAIGSNRLRSRSHWADHVFIPPLGSGHFSMDENFTMSGYTYVSYWARIEEIVKRIKKSEIDRAWSEIESWLCG